MKLKQSQMTTLLWLNDLSDPLDDLIDWLFYSTIGIDVVCIWVKNSEEFKSWTFSNGLPDAICCVKKNQLFIIVLNGY